MTSTDAQKDTSAVGIATTALYSILLPISDETGIPLSTLNAGTGYTFLFLGWGGLINQPLAMTFGKRGIYLISMVGSIGMCLWVPYIRTDGQWIASKIIQGFFCNPVESLCEVSIGDVFFAHERGTYIGIYTLFLFGSNFFTPLISGFIYDGQGWSWVMYWCAIINFGSLVIMFFFLEESNYNRKTIESAIVEEEKIKYADDGSSARLNNLVGVPRSFVSRLAVFNRRFYDNKMLVRMMYRPLLLLRFPIIFWHYGGSLIWYNVMNATASLILSGAPYNFKASSVGLSYIAPMIGISIGCAPFLVSFSPAHANSAHEQSPQIVPHSKLKLNWASSSNFFAPLISGFIYDGQGWSWVMYWCAIINFGSLAILFFFLEESNYTRETIESAIVEEEKIKYADDSSSTRLNNLVGVPSSFVSRLAVFSRRFYDNKMLVRMMYRPLLLLRFPIIFWHVTTHSRPDWSIVLTRGLTGRDSSMVAVSCGTTS
ncbi:uncharacterized protein FIBRA_09125 [Fibroporia radiculosa]|uniref:Major facilitator superfamily (MFS) profile domain-containing protein n=1 Tax=Fibroporia radiculosa TaxID=599839 RepID=J4I3V3_9APHY|nr:uncharacterized protein FIBRA_09125 [Fibroporia radiculosa]CCM06822.1 predicted protein [Fibroporia radiculosa]